MLDDLFILFFYLALMLGVLSIGAAIAEWLERRSTR